MIGRSATHPRRSIDRVLTVLLSASLAGSAACASTIPNVRPFATRTATLYSANDAETRAILDQYDASIELAGTVLALPEPRLSAEEREVVEVIGERLAQGRADFEELSATFDDVLAHAVVYSERLAELAAAGADGRSAAESLGSTIDGFGRLAGAGPVLTAPIDAILARVSEAATAIQARSSLREAAATAQGAVDDVATALTRIHRDHLQALVASLASDHDALLLWEAGPNIVGYYREADARRNTFYRSAQVSLQLNEGGIAGFCRTVETGELDPDCIDVHQLEALGEIEARLAGLRPEVERYEARRKELRAWRDARRANGTRTVRAVRTWARTHARVVDALEDGTGVSALSLEAILAEIESFR